MIKVDSDKSMKFSEKDFGYDKPLNSKETIFGKIWGV